MKGRGKEKEWKRGKEKDMQRNKKGKNKEKRKEKRNSTYLVGGFNHLEKYEFVNGVGIIPYIMENKT